MAFRKRYILAEEAEERIVSLFRKERNDAAEIFNTAIDACQTIILDMYDNAPDAVPVVRCKDCKHHEDEEPGMVYCPIIVGGWVHNDFFCGDGDRRE